MKTTPYNTGKVLIGCMYTPPPPTPTPEELWVQSALIGGKVNREEVLTAVFCTTLVAVVCVLMSVYTP
jgi:hypothetical protein